MLNTKINVGGAGKKVDKLTTEQCPICLKKCDLAAGHSYATVKSKDRLCEDCKNALGSFVDDLFILNNAYAYLNRAILRWVDSDMNDRGDHYSS